MGEIIDNLTRVIIAGSRDFNDWETFNLAMLEHFPFNFKDGHSNIEIISGGCRGADAMGEKFGKSLGVKVTVFPADWDRYGKSAGPIRNEQMAKYAAEADKGMLIAFPIGNSRGTYNMIALAGQYGLDVYTIPVTVDK